MKIIKTVKALRKELDAVSQKGKTIGFVPTMGYFHEGHLSLMRKARGENEVVVVSLFVNPAQFGPQEDLKSYPRDLKRDARLARTVGVDVLFVPDVSEVYPERVTGPKPEGFRLPVTLTNILCGITRPGHFDGVVTVVLKLLSMVRPTAMYLGQKDAQQVVVLKHVIQKLNLPVKVKVGSIIRETDGLAMSSRNSYLSPTEKEEAQVLNQALKQASLQVSRGERSVAKIIFKIKKLLETQASASIEYVSIVDEKTLREIKSIKGSALIALAVKIGQTRLIDNVIVKVHGRQKTKS